MGIKRNDLRNVRVLEIKKNRDLAIGAPQKDVLNYEKVISAYGNVVPAVVADEGGAYRLIDGHARLEACARMGVSDIPAVIAKADGAAEQAKLSLLLSASRERGSPLSEGAMVEKLVNEHGQTLGGLSAFVGRSKAWLSKRQTMARNLSPAVAGMVLGGTLCARTAEEVAKLPQCEQAVFAANAARDRLSKDDVCSLVRMYRSADATLELCRAIIYTPEDALPACRRGGKTRRSRSGGPADGRLNGAARLALDLLEGIAKMVCALDDAGLGAARARLLELRGKLLVLAALIDASCHGADVAPHDVSPGKRQTDCGLAAGWRVQ